MRLFLVAVLSLTFLSACDGRDVYSGTLILDGDHRVAPNETMQGELVVLGGEVALAESSHLTGSLYIVNGAVEVNGQVGGDVALLAGRLVLGPEARIEGRIASGGGELIQAPEAVVIGGVEPGTGIPLSAAVPTEGGRGSIPIIPSLVLALLAGLAVRSAPRAIFRIADAIRDYAVVCTAMGVLAGLVGLVLVVSMAFTIVLIPVALLTGLGLAAAVALGWIGAGALIGRALAGRLHRPIGQPLAAFLGTLLFVALVTLFNLLPFVSGLVMMLLAAVALGAVLLTRLGSRQFVPASETWEPVPDGPPDKD